MSDFNDNPWITKIKALLNKAENVAKLGHQAEADSYNEKAVELMAKYGVDRALLAASGKIEDKIVNKRIPMPETFTMDRRCLLNAIVMGLGAQVIFLSRRRPGTSQSYTYTGHVFAFESDMERIELLFEMLSSQMVLGAAAVQIPYWENKRSYRKSWMSGFAEAIGHRLTRNEEQAATNAGVGTDIVLFDRSKAVKGQFDIAHPPKDTKTVARSLNGTGRQTGYAAGQRANIGNNVGGSRLAING